MKKHVASHHKFANSLENIDDKIPFCVNILLWVKFY